MTFFKTVVVPEGQEVKMAPPNPLKGRVQEVNMVPLLSLMPVACYLALSRRKLAKMFISNYLNLTIQGSLKGVQRLMFMF